MGISKVEVNNADGTKNVLVDLTGDTVTADMLAKGVTAHGADGELVAGILKDSGDISDYPYTASNAPKHTGSTVKYLDSVTNSIKQTLPKRIQLQSYFSNLVSKNGRCIMDTSKDNKISLASEATNFGDATAEDVAKGKTFTSVAGLKVTGTAEPMVSNDNCEAYNITDKSTALNFKRTDGTIKVWGYGYASSGYTTTIYAFVGDGYYKGSSWGTPSKTSKTFGINSDGTLSGLPGGLTALDVLVTKGI